MREQVIYTLKQIAYVAFFILVLVPIFRPRFVQQVADGAYMDAFRVWLGVAAIVVTAETWKVYWLILLCELRLIRCFACFDHFESWKQDDLVRRMAAVLDCSGPCCGVFERAP